MNTMPGNGSEYILVLSAEEFKTLQRCVSDGVRAYHTAGPCLGPEAHADHTRLFLVYAGIQIAEAERRCILDRELEAVTTEMKVGYKVTNSVPS